MTRTESLGESLSSERYLLMGEGVREGPVLVLEDVVRDPGNFGERVLRIEGVIESVAEGRLTLAGARPVVVRFGPGVVMTETGLAGRTARFEGTLSISDGALEFAATGGAIER